MKNYFLFLVITTCSLQAIHAQNVGIGTTTPTAKLDIAGDLILRSADLTLLDGNTHDLDVNSNKLNHYRLIGPTSNFQIGGILAAEHDRIVTLYNRAGVSLEVYNEDIFSVDTNRILTGTGGTFAIYPGGNVSLKYDNNINRWEIISSHYNSLDNFGSGNWALSGDDIYNANVGNVGIKTTTPMTSLQVDGNLSLVSDTILGPCSSMMPPINNYNILIDNTTKKRSVFHILKDISCSVSLPPYLLGLIGGTDGQIVTIFMHMDNSQVKHLTGLTTMPSSADSMNMIELYEPNSNGNVNQPSQLTFNTGGAITLIYDGARSRWKPINYYGEIKSETYGWLKGGGPNSLINPNGGNCKVGIGLFTPTARLEAANTTNNEVAIKGWSTGVGGTAAHFSSTNGNALIVDQGKVGIGVLNPTKAKFEANSEPAKLTNAIFGSNGQGISLQKNWPSIGFNTYRDETNTHRYLGGGYGFGFAVDPSNGLLVFNKMGTGQVDDLVGANEQTVMGINQNGNVGIGIVDGQSKLSVYQPNIESNGNTHLLHLKGQNPVQFFSDQFNTNRGYIKGVTNLSNSNVFGNFGIEVGAAGGDIYFTSAGYQCAMMVNGTTNNVGIGTIYPSHKLSVNGTIRTKEVIVEAANWPDYVFAKDYALPSLHYIEKYINEHGHLPSIPSSKQIEENGQALGDTQKKMMEKIEELTLYIIRLNKEVELLKNNQNK